MIITEVKSYDLDNYNCDILLIPTCFSQFSNLSFTIEEIKNIKNRNIALKIDKIIDEFELDALEDFIKSTLNMDIRYYVFTDMSVYSILNKYNITNKGMYFSKTINCSRADIREYNMLGLKCLVSTELPLEDIRNISNLKNNIFYSYGYSNMFYSKRKLIDLYKQYSGNDFESLNKMFMLEEETRKNERYPILQNNNGTFIFTSFIHVLFKEIDSIDKDNFFYIDSTFIEENDLFNILDIYKQGFSKGFSEELYSMLLKINSNVSGGFLYIKPSILKEEN